MPILTSTRSKKQKLTTDSLAQAQYQFSQKYSTCQPEGVVGALKVIMNHPTIDSCQWQSYSIILKCSYFARLLAARVLSQEPDPASSSMTPAEPDMENEPISFIRLGGPIIIDEKGYRRGARHIQRVILEFASLLDEVGTHWMADYARLLCIIHNSMVGPSSAQCVTVIRHCRSYIETSMS